MASSSPGLNYTAGNSTADDVGRGPRAAFLLIFAVVTFIGDVFLLTITLRSPHRKIVQNILIANMCAVGLVDCACNMSIVFGSVTSNQWKFGRAVCKVNAFFMSFVAVHVCMMLSAFSLDRYLMLRFSSKYESWFSSYKVVAVLTCLWLYSVIFSIPYTTDSVPLIFQDQIHICGVAGETPLIFVCISLLVCYVCPVLMTVLFIVAHSRLTCKLQFVQKNKNIEKPYTQIDKEDKEGTTVLCSPKSFHSTHLPPILFTLWIILKMPFVIRNHIQQFEHSIKRDSPESFSWKVDTIFLWMRFLNTAFFPCLVLLCKKELWQNIKDCCLCRRSNAVVDVKNIFLESKNSVVSKTDDNDRSLAKKEDKKVSEKEIDPPTVAPDANAFTVPVLFATSTGICIEESPCRKRSQAKGRNEDVYFLANLTHKKGKTLDISYSEYDCPQEFVGDTSDYESSCDVDLYSISQPVSIRNVQESLHANKRRTVSNPDIKSCAHFQQMNPETKTGSFPKSSVADSGLDLTGVQSLAAFTSATK
ncbi:melanin-concentrating hormone receptor 2 [Elysia marginata]|uniref:Melanin-concentrating hormone receptor 2 n=1 Tax=Elysia marginata TaxID=1093978 RepID=A0AAV4HWV1_9GAST|nr:melanin-concentrating hormone receptor 2 [Elysia marginata]